MDRKKELLKLAGDDVTLIELVSKMLFLEKRLEELEKLPFIKVNPNNPAQQKATPAAKQYKELLQQYTNCIKYCPGLEMWMIQRTSRRSESG